MENIFKNAYFGKEYKTRDDRKAIYIEKDVDLPGSYLKIEGKGGLFYIGRDGYYLKDKESPWDIVSEWQEEISEEELDKKFNEFVNSDDFKSSETPYFYFMVGYRKAIENKYI